jgi:hypothetical protein
MLSKQSYQFWQIFEGLVMENVGEFYGCLVYFTAFCSISSPFGIFLVIWGIWYPVPRKIWQPCSLLRSVNHHFPQRQPEKINWHCYVSHRVGSEKNVVA